MSRIFVVLMITLLSLSISNGETWRIASLNWEPYSGAELKSEGNSIQRLREALDKEGIKLIVEFYPWKRAQEMAKKKNFLGYFPAWPEEVQEGFTASPAIDTSEIGILKRDDVKLKFTTIDDLFKNYEVGIISTYVYPKEIEEVAKKYPKNVDKAPDEVSLMKKLSIGRHQVAITDPNVMQYLASKHGISNIEIVKTISQKELVISINSHKSNISKIKVLNKLFK